MVTVPCSKSAWNVTGCMTFLASKRWGLALRSGCTSPLMQKFRSEGVPLAPKSPPKAQILWPFFWVSRPWSTQSQMKPPCSTSMDIGTDFIGSGSSDQNISKYHEPKAQNIIEHIFQFTSNRIELDLYITGPITQSANICLFSSNPRPGHTVLVDDIPVLFECSKGVAHGMRVLHHDQGQSGNISFVELAILHQFLMAGVHRAEDVSILILSKKQR